MMETTSDMENSIKNILDLPEEILRNIFKFVPDHANLSLVCSKFYEISCQSKYFKCNAVKMLLHANFASSRRRFKSVTLGDGYCENDLDCSWLTHRHVKQLKRMGKYVRSLRIGLTSNTSFTNLLVLFPNLEQIQLEFEVNFLKLEPESHALLYLPKIKQLILSNYSSSWKIFKCFPRNVLREIHVANCYDLRGAGIRQFFNSQRRIEEISLSSHLLSYINFNALNWLKTIRMQSLYETDDLESMFKELKSLETVHLGFYDCSGGDFARSLSKLRYLQTLSIQWRKHETDLHCLDELSSKSLRNLRLESVHYRANTTDSTLYSLSQNLPALDNLHLESIVSIQRINTVIEYFSNLKTLYLNHSDSRYVFQDNLKHNLNHNLNTLKIYTGIEDGLMSEDIPKLLAACKNLNYFETKKRIDEAEIEAILRFQPKLTRLFIIKWQPELLTTRFMKTLQEHGKNLLEFSCKFKGLDEEVTEELVEAAFKNNFKNIEFTKEFWGTYVLKMNKGIPIGSSKEFWFSW